MISKEEINAALGKGLTQAQLLLSGNKKAHEEATPVVVYPFMS